MLSLLITLLDYNFLDAIMAWYGKRMYEASRQLLAKNEQEVCVRRKLFPEASTEANGRSEKVRNWLDTCDTGVNVGKFYKNANTEQRRSASVFNPNSVNIKKPEMKLNVSQASKKLAQNSSGQTKVKVSIKKRTVTKMPNNDLQLNDIIQRINDDNIKMPNNSLQLNDASNVIQRVNVDNDANLCNEATMHNEFNATVYNDANMHEHGTGTSDAAECDLLYLADTNGNIDASIFNTVEDGTNMHLSRANEEMSLSETATSVFSALVNLYEETIFEPDVACKGSINRAGGAVGATKVDTSKGDSEDNERFLAYVDSVLAEMTFYEANGHFPVSGLNQINVASYATAQIEGNTDNATFNVTLYNDEIGLVSNVNVHEDNRRDAAFDGSVHDADDGMSATFGRQVNYADGGMSTALGNQVHDTDDRRNADVRDQLREADDERNADFECQVHEADDERNVDFEGQVHEANDERNVAFEGQVHDADDERNVAFGGQVHDTDDERNVAFGGQVHETEDKRNAPFDGQVHDADDERNVFGGQVHDADDGRNADVRDQVHDADDQRNADFEGQVHDADDERNVACGGQVHDTDDGDDAAFYGNVLYEDDNAFNSTLHNEGDGGMKMAEMKVAEVMKMLEKMKTAEKMLWSLKMIIKPSE